MKFPYLFALLICLSSYLFCQSDIDKLGHRVISRSGLNIRKLPTKESRIIGGIPFLEEVKILGTSDDWKRDTIGRNIFFNHFEDDYDIPIIGNWISVSYAEMEGFVFSPYVAFIEEFQENSIENINTAYGINFPGQLCFDNIHRSKNMTWFGLYEAQKKGEYIFKPIDVSYNITDTEYTWLNVLGGEKGLLFMYGIDNSKKMHKDVIGQFSSLFLDEMKFISNEKYCPIYEDNDLYFENNNGYWHLFLNRQGRTQMLNPEKHNLSTPESLVWRGDIDGDNIDDYIIRYGDKSTQVVLYLSSEAEEGELVRPVAIFYTGYCC